jgi:hypothetical protein
MVAPHDIRVTCIEFDHSVLVSNALVERIFPDVQRPAEDSILAQLSSYTLRDFRLSRKYLVRIMALFTRNIGVCSGGKY